MTTALEGIRVLELGEGKALATAGKLLRDLGAEVVKVEPPEGDALRRYGPFPGDEPHPERSGLFIYLNAGKRGARLELGRSADRSTFDGLIEGADVLLHSFRPSEAEDLGLDAGTLLGRRPQLVVAAVTTFGSSGPCAEWLGYPIQAYAGSGVMYRIGEPDREPLTQPLDGAEVHHAGPQTAAAVALALVHRERTGRGQFVDLSVLEAVTVSVWGHGIPNVVYVGQPMGYRVGRKITPGWPWGVWETTDGDFALLTLLNRHWQAFIHELGDPEWAQPQLIARLGDPAHHWALTPEDGVEIDGVLGEHLAPWLRERTNAELWDLFRRIGVPFLPVLTVPQIVESDEAEARGLFVEAPGPHPPLRVPRPPYLLSGTPARSPGEPPSLDAPSATAWRGAGAEPRGTAGGELPQPLSGIRVLDLGQVWAGPLLGRYLADYGADVVHVRPGSRPPTTPGSTDPESPLAWEWVYRNRRSLALDLKQPGAVDLFRRLVAAVDVVIDNFSPRVLPSLGLGYEELTAANPRLIMATLPASGRTGPWSDLLSYGPTLEALYGMKSLNGYPEDRLLMEQQAELDPISVTYAAYAVFAAIYHRERTGRGQLIELAQGEACLAGLGEAVIEHVWNARELGPLGNTHRVLAPHGAYPCAGDDQWIAIACGPDEEWRALADAAGHGEWVTRLEFATAEARRGARHELDRAIGEWSRAHEKYALTRRLQDAGVAAFPVLDALEVVSDPHHSARRRHFVLDPRFTADELLNGNAWHLSEAPPRLRYPSPAHGAHNVEVLGELLGMAEPEVRALERAGVLA